jgi:thiamine-phosphate pyrophosphorylase
LKRLFTKSKFLYLLTDRNIARISHIQVVRKALLAGVRTIQLREKHMSKRELYKEAVAIKELVRKHRAMLIINDYVDIAKAVDADGVHLGQEDMPVEEARLILGKRKVIGISTHSLSQAVRAEKSGANYIGFGPIFQTSTKNAGRPKGIDGLRKIRKHVHIPVVAIGGSGDIKMNVERFVNTMKGQVMERVRTDNP